MVGFTLGVSRLRYTRLRRLSIHPVVDLREDVVPLLELPNDGLAEAALRKLAEQPAIEVGEARDVVARSLLGVLDHGARLHDERPVRGLRQQQLAGGLVQRAAVD